MDVASVVGLLTGGLLIVGAVLLRRSSLAAFVDIPSLAIVVGGSACAVLICFPMKRVLRTPAIVLKAFRNQSIRIEALIHQLVQLAEEARREGLLSLEPRLAEIDHPFMTLGIQLAMDGTRAELIEDILRTEMDAVATRHREGKAILDQAGRFAPAFGMIGTLLGLIMMLGNMTEPSAIAGGMAVALITTLYGTVAANILFIPIAEKLGYISKQERLAMEIIVRGVMAIQSGENPRVVEQKLSTFLPARERLSRRRAA